jgi:hypothetical protein
MGLDEILVAIENFFQWMVQFLFCITMPESRIVDPHTSIIFLNEMRHGLGGFFPFFLKYEVISMLISFGAFILDTASA